MAVPILAREQRWECPSCDLQQVTHRADVHTEFHHCAGLAGLWAPMVAAGTRAEHRAVEREDYIGAERVQVDGNGRPVMSVVTGNELANGGWSTAGLALTSVTSTFTSNVYTLDAADTANGSAATISGAFGCLIYDDTLTTPVADQGICFLSFGGTNSVTAGTLTVVYNASGIMTLTL
jgi:hypothetical protein